MRGSVHEEMAIVLGVTGLILLAALLLWFVGGDLGWWPYPQEFTKH